MSEGIGTLRELRAALDGGKTSSVEIVGECVNAEEVLQQVRADPSIDVVLLDIHMPGLSGMDALSIMGDTSAQVVFCTAHTDRAVEAFGRIGRELGVIK